MKKKIKNLNQNELDKFCLAHSCGNCPLCILEGSNSNSNYYCLAPLVLDKKQVRKIMETEIEVEVKE